MAMYAITQYNAMGRIQPKELKRHAAGHSSTDPSPDWHLGQQQTKTRTRNSNSAHLPVMASPLAGKKIERKL